MPVTFRAVEDQRANVLLQSGGARGEGTRLILDFLAFHRESGAASAEFTPAEADLKVTIKNEETGVEETRLLRPSEIVAKVKAAAVSRNYAVTAVVDAGNVVLIRLPEDQRPDPKRQEGTAPARAPRGKSNKSASK